MAQVKKKSTKATEKPVTTTTAATTSDKVVTKETHHWNLGPIFWGLLLVVIGGLLLLANLGLITLHWENVWRLWPLAIIASGVSILAVRSYAWRVVSIVLMVLTLAAVVTLAVGGIKVQDSPYQTFRSSTVQAAEGVSYANVSVEAGGSKLKVTTGDTDKIAEATFRSSISKLKESSYRSGDTQFVNFSSENMNGMWFMGSWKSEWDVVVSRTLPLSLTLNAGASEVDADVSKAEVRNLNLDAGASSSTITIGDKAALTRIKIDAGASRTVLRLPKTSGVSLELDGGLVNKEVADLRQIDEKNYRSEGYETADKKIEITADIGAASFTIERY